MKTVIIFFIIIVSSFNSFASNYPGALICNFPMENDRYNERFKIEICQKRAAVTSILDNFVNITNKFEADEKSNSFLYSIRLGVDNYRHVRRLSSLLIRQQDDNFFVGTAWFDDYKLTVACKKVDYNMLSEEFRYFLSNNE